MQNKGIVKFIAVLLILVCCSRVLLLPFLLIRDTPLRE